MAIILNLSQGNGKRSIPIILNWNNVSYAEQSYNGTILHMNSGEKVMVEEYLDEVSGKIKGIPVTTGEEEKCR